MKIVVVVQARMASHRLPGKVMLDLVGAPVLQRMLERVLGARSSFELVVATSRDPSCDEIDALCRRIGVACHRGHPTDLLDRHYQVGCSTKADAVVKIPSDCPLIDPRVIDRVLSRYLEANHTVDFVGNLHPPSYPDGNDVEVMAFEALETAWSEAVRPLEREHTTPFLWDRPERFRLLNVEWETGMNYSKTHRWTLDYIHDYRLIQAVYHELWTPSGAPFSLQEVLDFLEQRPDVRALNQRWLGASWMDQHRDELRTAARWGLGSNADSNPDRATAQSAVS